MDVGYYEIDSLRRDNVANKNTQQTENVILARRLRRKLFKKGWLVIKTRFTTAENIHLFHCLYFDIHINPLTKYMIIL